MEKANEPDFEARSAELLEFTQQDWMSFPGAEPFRDGSEPLVGEFPGGAALVADRFGVTILFRDEQAETWEFRSPWPLGGEAPAVERKELAKKFFRSLLG